MCRKASWILGLIGVLGMSQAVSASSIILNEYNAIDSTVTPSKADTYFGKIQGNGGNWFELVVTEDHLNMTGWTLNWKETDNSSGNKAGTIYLSNNSFWSDVRQGVILTFIENFSATGGKDTDTSLNYTTDWWVNICTLSEQAKYNANDPTSLAHTVYTAGGGNIGDFTTSNDGWALQICDSEGHVVMAWTGEGVFCDGGVNSQEVFKLETNPSASILPTDPHYNDGSSSTFGSANIWSSGACVQNFSALRAWAVPEPATLIFLTLGSLAGIFRKK